MGSLSAVCFFILNLYGIRLIVKWQSSITSSISVWCIRISILNASSPYKNPRSSQCQISRNYLMYSKKRKINFIILYFYRCPILWNCLHLLIKRSNTRPIPFRWLISRSRKIATFWIHCRGPRRRSTSPLPTCKI